MKDGICTAIGVVGSTIASFFGGFDAALDHAADIHGR